MSTSTNFHASGPNWGGSTASGSLGTSLSDPFGQPRTHYQAGYMMSATQQNPLSQNNQRIDEIPTIQTKAKLNHGLGQGLSRIPNFGMDSMFEGKRQRQTITDEDAPPTNSINEITQEMPQSGYVERNIPTNVQNPLNSSISSHWSRPYTAPQQLQPQFQAYFVIVFGYPNDKYHVAVDYFKSIGETTEPEVNTEVMNCFRIGYKDAGEAMRAVRRNGEIISGSWMVGVKWADPAQAEAWLGRSAGFGSIFPSPNTDLHTSPTSPSPIIIDPSPQKSISPHKLPGFGTPIQLAPASSAYLKKAPTSTPKQDRNTGSAGTPSFPSTVGQSPSKGVLGQVSDLIFGW